jgi:hypothetical protein
VSAADSEATRSRSPRGPGTLPAWIEAGILGVLFAVFSAMVVGEARHYSVTVDEFHLVPQAIALRATGDLDLGYKTPPLLKRWIGLALPPASVSLPSHIIDGQAAADDSRSGPGRARRPGRWAASWPRRSSRSHLS